MGLVGDYQADIEKHTVRFRGSYLNVLKTTNGIIDSIFGTDKKEPRLQIKEIKIPLVSMHLEGEIKGRSEIYHSIFDSIIEGTNAYDFGYVSNKVTVYDSVSSNGTGIGTGNRYVNDEYFRIYSIENGYAKIGYFSYGQNGSSTGKDGYISVDSISSYSQMYDVVTVNHRGDASRQVEVELVILNEEAQGVHSYNDPFKYFSPGAGRAANENVDLLMEAGRKIYGHDDFIISAFYGELYSQGLHEGTDFVGTTEKVKNGAPMYPFGNGNVVKSSSRGVNQFVVDYDGIYGIYQHSSNIPSFGSGTSNDKVLAKQSSIGAGNQIHLHLEITNVLGDYYMKNKDLIQEQPLPYDLYRDLIK